MLNTVALELICDLVPHFQLHFVKLATGMVQIIVLNRWKMDIGKDKSNLTMLLIIAQSHLRMGLEMGILIVHLSRNC